MKINTVIGIFAAVMTLLFFTGCVTDYRAEAAEDAREYLLENLEGLTVLQQNYIRYNDPIILNQELWKSTVPDAIPDAHIVTRHERNTYADPRRDMMMQCFGWRVPGMDKDVLVVGTAQRDFRFWEVNRIVLRSREKRDLAGSKIRKKAMMFAVSALPELKGQIYHKVRFATPDVHKTIFLLDQPKKPATQDSWLDFLKVAAAKEPLQISAVWIDPETNQRIVVTGLSKDEKLGNWRPVKVFVIPEEEVKTYIGSKHTVYPDDSEDPFSPDYKKEGSTGTEESKD